MNLTPDHRTLDEFAIQFARLASLAADRLRASAEPSDLVTRLTDHLGVDPRGLPIVRETYPPYDHANMQVAIEAYLAGDGRHADLVGISGGGGREHHALTELIEMAAQHGAFRLGAVEYGTVAVGVDAELTCVQFGLYLVADGDTRFAVLARGAAERHGQPRVGLEVLVPEPAVAQGFLAEIRALMHGHNVFRGQVVSFEGHGFAPGAGPLRFHARPALRRSDVVLPPGVLDVVERQVAGVAAHRDRLLAAGYALKRGVLLFGPPGTGKTHTVRYLISRLPSFTVVQLSGLGLQFIADACALARYVQPALVVLEDVDLVAEARTMRPGMMNPNPLLFQVLNELDGLAGDADVAFILTTNRVDLLEPALAQRPGRVDAAVEVPLPDPAARRDLLALYGGGLVIAPGAVDRVIAETDGVTASYFAELARRAALLAATDGSGTPTEEHVWAALAELSASRQALLSGRGSVTESPGAFADPAALSMGWAAMGGAAARSAATLAWAAPGSGGGPGSAAAGGEPGSSAEGGPGLAAVAGAEGESPGEEPLNAGP